MEIDPPLIQLVEANGARIKHRRSSPRFVCQSAAEFDCDEVNVVVRVYPFGSETMRAVLVKWKESLAADCRHSASSIGNFVLSPLLVAQPVLELYHCWNPGAWSRVEFPVHFYRSTVM